jgi:sugar-specific transcriptional regulator TrmB
MTQNDTIDEAVSLLQDLGLQEYEARCFLALTQLPSGTAKEVHELSGVPRTRVYDAIRVLESEGLVEVQHSSPQRFRSVGIEEAVGTLRRKYSKRFETLESYLETLEVHDTETSDDRVQQVWSLSGHEAVESRMFDLLDEAETEIALLVSDEALLSDAFFERLHDAVDREIRIVLGGRTESITERLGSALPNASVFETDLDFLTASGPDHEVAISRILLVDRETLLIASYYPDAADEPTERAVIARGLENGVVVLLRRLIASGLPNDGSVP